MRYLALFTSIFSPAPVSISIKERRIMTFLPEFLKPEERQAEEHKEGRFWIKKGVGEKLKASGLLCMQGNQVRSGGAQSERKLAAAQLLWKRRRGQPSSTPCSI